jgi:hypothetical protein
VYLTNANLREDWSDTFSSEIDNFRVSPGNLKSRMSVNFGGQLFDGDIPLGIYKVGISVYYPGYSTVCSAEKQAEKQTIIPSSTSVPGPGNTPRPTSELPPTNTPGSPPGPTEPAPTPRD